MEHPDDYNSFPQYRKRLDIEPSTFKEFWPWYLIGLFLFIVFLLAYIFIS